MLDQNVNTNLNYICDSTVKVTALKKIDWSTFYDNDGTFLC